MSGNGSSDDYDLFGIPAEGCLGCFWGLVLGALFILVMSGAMTC